MPTLKRNNMYLAKEGERFQEEKSKLTDSITTESAEARIVPSFQERYSLPNNTTYINRSNSIPISMRRSVSQHQMTEEEVETDYRDYLFYSRVVNGIKTTTEKEYENKSLHYENKLCLENIAKTRNDLKDKSVDNFFHDHPTSYDNEEDNGGVFILDL
jgi:hypothetical protein